MAKRQTKKISFVRKSELGDTNALTLVLGGFVLMLIGAFLGYMYFAFHNANTTMSNKSQGLNTNGSVTSAESPMPKEDPETSTWKTYENTSMHVSFKYPDGYVLMQDSPQEARFGFKPSPSDEIIPVLTVETYNLIDYKQYKSCSSTTTFPCMNSIKDISINGISGKDVSFTYGADGDTEIIQLNTQPAIEFNMNTSGPRRALEIQQIVSTIKLLK